MLPRMHVSRPRLLKILSQAVGCKLTIVCADAGYGKTSLVTEFVRVAGLRNEWHQLTSADRDVVRLAEGLEACLRRLTNGARPGGVSRTRLQRAKGHDVLILTEGLLRQASRVGAETALLVLDDYQSVDREGDVNLLLALLIENSPSCLRFVVLSRSVPRFSLARLKARQEIYVIGENELAFTMEETARFLSGKSGCDLDEDAMVLVQERTEGWPAGVAMVSQSLRHGVQDRVMSVLTDPVASAWLVYDYLAEEVFDRQHTAVREFLIKSSILSTMKGPVCDHLLSINYSLRTLLSLEEGGLFTVSVDPSRQTFRYHQLFREFLRQKLHQLKPAEVVTALHLRAAQFYESHHEWEACVDHYLKAGEPVKAAQVVETIGETYILGGFLQTVDHWLRVLPEDLTSTRPWLLVLRAGLSHMSLKNEEALRLLERALRVFQASGDDHGEAYALGEMAFVRYRSHQIQQSIQNYEVALSKADGDSSLRASIMARLAPTYRYGGMLEASLEACQLAVAEAEGIPEELRRLQIQSRATRHKALAMMEQGDLEAARQVGQEALEICSSHDLGEYEHSWALIHLGTVLWACGSLEDCIDVLNRALSMAGRHIRQVQEKIGLRLGTALRDSGRIAEAERVYAMGGWEADFDRAFLAVLTRHGGAAITRAEALHQRWHLSENIVARTCSQIVLAAAVREGGYAERGLELAKESVRILEAGGYRFRLASALLHQARLEFELRLPEAFDSLTKGFRLSAASKFYHFSWWDPELIAFLCQKALEESILPEYAYRLASQRLGNSRVATLSHLPIYRRMEMLERGESARSHRADRVSGYTLAELLAGCPDPHVSGSIQRAVADDLLSVEGLRTLRTDYGLTWREIEVFLEYYLRPALESEGTNLPLRMSCAKRLGISKNTVRCHISSIRSKLSLPSSLSGKGILAWVELQGLFPAATLRHHKPFPPLPTGAANRSHSPSGLHGHVG